MSTTVENVIRAVIQSLKAKVCPNVDILTHTDYSELAELPAFVLSYPEIDDYRPNEMNERRVIKNVDGTTTIKQPVLFKTFSFTFEIVAEKMTGVNGIAQLQMNYLQWANANRIIAFDDITCEMITSDPMPPRFAPNLSNLKRADGQFSIIGIEIDAGTEQTGFQVMNRDFESRTQ